MPIPVTVTLIQLSLGGCAAQASYPSPFKGEGERP